MSATEWAIAKNYDGEWDTVGDVATSLGANDDAVGIPTATWAFETYTVEEYEAQLAAIKAGELVVDNAVLENDGVVNAGLENITIIYE